MRTFEVKAPIQLSNKKVAEFGAIVSEKQLHDNADELVKRGFIKEVVIDEKVLEIEVEETEVNFSQMNKKSLIDYAIKNNINIDVTLTNKEMVKVITEIVEQRKSE
jgi:hypothetical protein